VVSSTDGFCSVFSFTHEDFGEPLSDDEQSNNIEKLREIYAKVVSKPINNNAAPSELATSDMDVPIQTIIQESVPIVNILPVKRRVQSTLIAL